MKRFATSTPRGLTLLELLLALAVTAMVGAAIAAMLGAVTAGVITHRDSRAAMVQASAAQARLAAYILPSRCILAAGAGNLILWFNDQRASDTVHATEVRWLIYDSNQGVINVFFVSFPADWEQIEKDLEDGEYPSNTNWMTLLDTYMTKGWVAGFTLVDGLESVSLSLDHAQAQQARQATYRLGFASDSGEVVTLATGVIRDHYRPMN
ncbi:MAG TPA: hypothetical protein PK400_02185 [Phycisphaerales bacterium]|nr:hypothetical protein [Phycisphaerales bacterium]HRQ75233.1 hypothetical protein [Phycisphaerales bacterium]